LGAQGGVVGVVDIGPAWVGGRRELGLRLVGSDVPHLIVVVVVEEETVVVVILRLPDPLVLGRELDELRVAQVDVVLRVVAGVVLAVRGHAIEEGGGRTVRDMVCQPPK
ncbi:hypothetical protein KEM52_005055, partial [Ascosphaera acerosa]